MTVDSGAALMLGALPDGRQLRCRSLRPQDSAASALVHRNLSPRRAHFRYFGLRTAEGDIEVARILAGDPDRLSLLGLIGDSPVALAEIAGLSADRSSTIALSVSDPFQNVWIGTLMLTELVRRAVGRGLLHLIADIIPGDRLMADVVGQCGYSSVSTYEHGVETVHLRF